MPKTAPPPPSSSSPAAAGASRKHLLRATVVSPATARRRKSYPRVPGKGSLRVLSQLLRRNGGIRHPEAMYYPDTLEDTRAYSRQVEEEERRRLEEGGAVDEDKYHPHVGPPLGLPRPHRRHSSWSAAPRSIRSAESDDGGTSSDDEFVVYVPTAASAGAANRPVAARRSWSGPGRSRYNGSRMSVPVAARSCPHYRRVKSKSSPALSFSGRSLGGPTGGSFLYTLDEDRQVLPKNHVRLKKTLSSSI